MTTPQSKCQNCGYSSRHTKQQPGEKPEFVGCCKRWLCAACRNDFGCTGDSDHTSLPGARNGYPNGVPPNDGIYGKIPDTVYHGDPTSLSSSGARTIFTSTPAAFYQERITPRAPKKVYDEGHLAHWLVLGEGSKITVLDPKIHGRTKDGKIAEEPARTSMWRDAVAKARENGTVPIHIDIYREAQRMAGKVFDHPLAKKLLERGDAEMSGYWHDDETLARLRFRPDWLPDRPGQRMICVDYKSAKSANPILFRRSVEDYGYHCQAAWYLDGLREVGVADDAGFVFIVQEKTPPYLVSVVQLEPEDIERGRRQNRAAIDLYARCMESGVWPGYGEGLHTVGLSNWARTRIDDQLTELTARKEIA